MLRLFALLILCLPTFSFAQVGIGTNSPVDKLTIYNGNVSIQNANTVAAGSLASTNGTLKFYGSNNSTAYWAGIESYRNGFADNLDLRFFTQLGGSPSERMRISNDGKLGIGTTSPESLLHIAQSNSAAATTLYIDNTAASAVGNEAVLKFSVDVGGSVTNGGAAISAIREGSTAGYTDLRFMTYGPTGNLLESMRIKSNGQIGIRTTSPTYDFQVNGTIAYNSLVNTSDIRLKNISESISSDDSISTIRYEWKDGRDDRVHIGYGAQDVERILPDAVFSGNDGIKSVNYDEVHTYKLMRQELLIKELQQQIAELQKIVKRKRRIK